VSVEVHDLIADKAEAQKYGVDKIPAISVVGEKDYGVLYYGIPAGYEFTSLIEAIAEVSQGRTVLADETKQRLQAIDKDVHIQVFVTPT
jgi:alkyl hydroperoxide reductase subunit AhpF